MKREAERKKEKKKEEFRSVVAAYTVFRPFWAQTEQLASQTADSRDVYSQVVRSLARFVRARNQ